MRALLFSLLAAAGCAAQQPPPAPAPAPAATQDPLRRERAAAAENLGRYAEAADLYLQLMRSEPLRAEWAVAAARCLGRSGRFNDAIDLLCDKRNAFPGVTDVAAMLARTWLLKAEGDPGGLDAEHSYAEAVRLAEEVLAADPEHEDARLLLAQARLGQGDVAGAIAAAEAAVQHHPQRAGAHVLIGRIAFDRFKQLQRQFDAAQPDGPERAQQVAAIDEQRQRARRAFARAAELDPGRTFAQVMLAELAIWDKDTDLALQHWADALVRDPQARVDHDWIAANVPWQRRRDFYAGAAARYHAAPASDVKLEATLHWYAARAAWDGAQWQQARTLFEQVLQQNPTFNNACYWVALCAYKLGDHDGAETYAARYAAASATAFADVLRALAPEQRGEVAAVVKYLADRAYQHGRNDDSRDLNHVIAALQDSADAWNNYAFLCRETGQFQAAFAAYQHALEKEPDSPQLWNDAAVILQYHLPSPENLLKAREMYGRALDLADKVLGDPRAAPDARERAARAQNDARLNLAKLP